MRKNVTRMVSLLTITVLAVALALAGGEQPRRIEISVTEGGFQPSSSTVAKGGKIDLVFTRKTDHTCAKSVIVHAEGNKEIKRDLPLNTPVTIPLTLDKAGEVKYTCGMNMYSGVVQVQ